MTALRLYRVCSRFGGGAGIIAVLGLVLAGCPATTETPVFAPELTGTVSLSGNPNVGHSLTADISGLGGSGSVSFRWERTVPEGGFVSIRMGSDHDYFTHSSYTVQPVDYGQQLRVIATRSGYSGYVASYLTGVVSLLDLAGYVTIDGYHEVGSTLIANTSGLNGAGTPVFQWHRGNPAGTIFIPIPGANDPFFIVQTADIGFPFQVTVYYMNHTGSVTSEGTGQMLDRTVATQLNALRDMPVLPSAHRLEARFDEAISAQLLNFPGPIEITLESRAGVNTVLSLDGTGSMFTVGSGVTLILENVTLQGTVGNNNALVVVGNGSSLVMNDGSLITGNINPSDLLANRGGGVRVNPGGVFVLDGGEISDNIAHEGGGVFNQGSFVMYDGVIRNNIVQGTNAAGGGVSNRGTGTFTMRDGEISGNTALWGGGVASWHGGNFVMEGGIIYNNDGSTGGGGAFAGGGGTFTMQDGYIRGNRSVGTGTSNGGGVAVSGGAPGAMDWGIFIMHGGKISGNTARQAGGGVSNWTNGRFQMRGGIIYRNTANFSGGGVISFGAGWFSMTGGEISANTAPEGGGLNNQGGALFVMNGGTIHGVDAGSLANTASVSGGGATFINLPGAAGSRVTSGMLNEDHTSATGLQDFPTNNINISVDVENGEVMRISTTTLAHAGYSVRLVAYTGTAPHITEHIINDWIGVPATGAINLIFPAIPGNWYIGLQLAPAVGNATVYTVTRDLVRGVNAIPFGDFTPGGGLPPPTTVTSITITDIPAGYQGRGGDVDFGWSPDGVSITWTHPAVNPITSSMTFNITAAWEPGPRDLVAAFLFPPWHPDGEDVPESMYQGTIDLVAGPNSFPLSALTNIIYNNAAAGIAPFGHAMQLIERKIRPVEPLMSGDMFIQETFNAHLSLEWRGQAQPERLQSVR